MTQTVILVLFLPCNDPDKLTEEASALETEKEKKVVGEWIGWGKTCSSPANGDIVHVHFVCL